MSVFDIVFLIPLLWSAYKGFTKGFLFMAASLLALLLGIFGAIRFSHLTATLLIQKFGFTSSYTPVFAFAITFIIIVIAIHFISLMLDKLLKAIALGFINKILGILFGVAKTAFIISIILVFVNTVNANFNLISREAINKSLLYRPLSNFAPALFPYLKFQILHEEDQQEQIEGEIA